MAFAVAAPGQDLQTIEAIRGAVRREAGEAAMLTRDISEELGLNHGGSTIRMPSPYAFERDLDLHNLGLFLALLKPGQLQIREPFFLPTTSRHRIQNHARGQA